MFFSVDESTILTTDEEDDHMPRLSGSVVHYGIPKTCQYNSALQACAHEDLSELRVWVSHDQVPSDWLQHVIPVKCFEFLHRLGSIVLDDNSIDDYIHHNLSELEDPVMIETVRYMIRKGCKFSANTYYIIASNYEPAADRMLKFLMSYLILDLDLDPVIEYCIDNNHFKFVQLVMTTLKLQFTFATLQHLNDNWHLIPTQNEEACWWSHQLVMLVQKLHPVQHSKLIYWVECYQGRCMMITMFIKRMKLIPDELVEPYIGMFL